MRFLVISAFTLMTLTGPMPAAQAQGPGQVAINRCGNAVTYEVRGIYPPAGRVQFLGSAKLRRASNAETSVSGKGQFDSRRGWTKFSYHCTYNLRSGQTYGVDVRTKGSASADRPGSSGSSGSSAGKNVGAALGAIIAGAIISSIKKNSGNTASGGASNEWWSPSPGVQCSSYQSACYVGGSFSPQWTHKIYVR